MIRGLFVALILVAAPMAARAAATDWQEIGPGSQIRLISDDVLRDDGTTRVGIEIELAPDTRTYWRVPGESGIPLDLVLDGSVGIAGAEVDWPFPVRERRDGFLDHVYYGAVTLPVEVTVSADASAVAIHAQVTLGVCSDICIPAEAVFDLAVTFEKPDRAAGFRLDIAAEDVPIPDDRTPALFGAVVIDESGETLLVETSAPAMVAASLIVDGDDPAWLFGPPQNGPHSGLLELPVLAGGEGGDLLGESVRLSYMTDQGPFELTRQVGSGSSVDPAVAAE